VAIQILSFTNAFDLLGRETTFDGVQTGFLSGLSVSLGIIFIYLIIFYTRNMRNETKLKLLYNEEHDERKKEIKQKCGGTVMWVSSILIIFAAIIAGYFNEIVFYTLISCAAFQLYLSVILKIYYTRKL
jgi:hypothetical protein